MCNDKERLKRSISVKEYLEHRLPEVLMSDYDIPFTHAVLIEFE